MPDTASPPPSAPLIGVVGRRRKARDISGFDRGLVDFDADVYLANYHRDVLAAGGLPIPIPLDGDPRRYVPHLDGLLLTGGADIEPARYGDVPDGAGHYEPERDATELAIFDEALAADLPVLGICRGLQVVNVAAGGSLNQDVPSHSCSYDEPDVDAHRVSFEQHSRLSLLYGGSTQVNSLHHQTVDRLGEGLVVTGRADDDVVEAIELPGRDVIAVQWHPEMRSQVEPVFGWLIKRALAVQVHTGRSPVRNG
jgi:putative glutamine amidotransferase